MQPAVVLGTTHATIKHPSLRGQRMLVVQPVGVDDRPDGEPLIAIDRIGAGRGDRVMLTSDSQYTRSLTDNEAAPLRWSTMGVIDR